MTNNLEQEKADWFAKLDKTGQDQVRLTHSKSTYTGRRSAWTTEWLAQFERESREANESAQAESVAAAQEAASAASRAATAAETANDRATTANTIATLALTAAVIAIAVAVISAFLG